MKAFLLSLVIAFATFPLLTRRVDVTHPQTERVGPSLIGTWKLVSATETLRDGRTRPYPDLGPALLDI
jgi:hypothetical protein